MNKKLIVFSFAFAIILSFCQAVQAFPAFQNEIVARSKQPIDCSYCHRHHQGPRGDEEGQLGALSGYEKNFLKKNDDGTTDPTLNYRRSPILNDFGNYLIYVATYDGMLEGLVDFQALLDRFADYDFDADGISDKEEMSDGTLPNDEFDGHPFKMMYNRFKQNFGVILFWILSLCLASLGLYMHSNTYD